MKNQRQADGHHPSQPDHNPGHQPDAGDRSEGTREPRKRPALTADGGGSLIPPSDAGVVSSSPENAPSNDATTTATPTEQEERLLQLEIIIERGLTSVWEMGKAMLEIRDASLYLKHYRTFAAYCAERWAKHRSRCYQLMDAAEVQQNLSTQVDTSELTEKHCRELSKLKKPGEQITAWTEARAAARDGKVTFKDLKDVVAKLRPPTRIKTTSKAEPTTEVKVGAGAVGSENAVVNRLPEKPAPSQPAAPPADNSAALDFDDFDLHAEWRIVEDSLRDLFFRCPRYQQERLWAMLREFEYAPETTHRPRRSRRVPLPPPSNSDS